MCSICTDELSEGTTTLECGHSFHVGCIIQWFRLNNTTCPLCRAEGTWRVLSHRERVRLICRQRALPPTVRAKVRRLKALRVERLAFSREELEFRRKHAAVLKEHRRLERRKWKAGRREFHLEREIGRMPVPNVPLLVPPSDSDADADMY
jgi:hypothetical protein